MKTILVYCSHTNNNSVLAAELAKRLECTVLRLEERKRRTGMTILLDLVLNRLPALKPHPYSMGDFERVVLIAPVWAGRLATPMRSFLEQEKYNILTYSFITLCGGAPGQIVKLKHELAGILGKKPFRFTELRINDLWPEQGNNKFRFTTGFRVIPTDLEFFESEIALFVDALSEEVMV